MMRLEKRKQKLLLIASARLGSEEKVSLNLNSRWIQSTLGKMSHCRDELFIGTSEFMRLHLCGWIN